MKRITFISDPHNLHESLNGFLRGYESPLGHCHGFIVGFCSVNGMGKEQPFETRPETGMGLNGRRYNGNSGSLKRLPRNWRITPGFVCRWGSCNEPGSCPKTRKKEDLDFRGCGSPFGGGFDVPGYRVFVNL